MILALSSAFIVLFFSSLEIRSCRETRQRDDAAWQSKGRFIAGWFRTGQVTSGQCLTKDSFSELFNIFYCWKCNGFLGCCFLNVSNHLNNSVSQGYKKTIIEMCFSEEKLTFCASMCFSRISCFFFLTSCCNLSASCEYWKYHVNRNQQFSVQIKAPAPSAHLLLLQGIFWGFLSCFHSSRIVNGFLQTNWRWKHLFRKFKAF